MRQAGWQVDIHAMFATRTLAELAAAVSRPIDIVEVPPNRIPKIGIREESLNTIEIRI
jgi:hypothetical protein